MFKMLPFIESSDTFEEIYERYVFKKYPSQDVASEPKGITYMKLIYKDKERWAVSQGKHLIHITSRVESVNAQIKRFKAKSLK